MWNMIIDIYNISVFLKFMTIAQPQYELDQGVISSAIFILAFKIVILDVMDPFPIKTRKCSRYIQISREKETT